MTMNDDDIGILILNA